MAQFKQWQIQVYNKRTNSYVNDSVGKAYVMNSAQTLATSSTEVALKSNQQGTALTQPVTLSAGNLVFYTAKSVTAVDVSIMTESGHAIYAKAISSSVHRLDIYPEDRYQHLVAPFIFTNAVLVDTGFDFPAGCLIHDAYLRVLVVDATETIDVGFENAVESGDLDGLLALAITSSLGYIADPLGVLLTGEAAYDADTWRKRYLTNGTIKSLVYTPTAGSDTAKGLINVEYQLLG